MNYGYTTLGRRRPRTCSGPRASTRSPRRASTASRRRRPARRHKQHLSPVGRRCRLPRLRLHRVSRRLPDAQRRRSGRDCPPNSGSRDKLGALSPLARASECLYSCLGLRPQVVIGVRLQGEREPQGESSRFCQVWWSWGDSNPRLPPCKGGALPAELQPHSGSLYPTSREIKRGIPYSGPLWP